MHWPTPSPAEPQPAAPAARFFLSDGTPLTLTWSRKSMYVSLTQRAGVSDPEEAGLLLYLCSPQYDPRSRWRVPAPSETGEDPDLSETAPALFAAVRLAADEWADEHLPHADWINLTVLAQSIWMDAHETMVVPATEQPQKKNGGEYPHWTVSFARAVTRGNIALSDYVLHHLPARDAYAALHAAWCDIGVDLITPHTKARRLAEADAVITAALKS